MQCQGRTVIGFGKPPDAGRVKVSGQANFIEVLGGGAELSSQPRLRLSLVDFG
jgi:hypothetical protein